MQNFEKNKLLEYWELILKKYWLFLPAFILMAVYLKFSGSMAAYSGDAASIWETIRSFYSTDIVPSYVLYKGFASVYPYVWFYQLSQLFGVGDFFFIKLFHCTLFAYITTIGFPFVIEKILGVRPRIWRRVILIAVMFWLWIPSHTFTQIMVDMPCLAYFLLLLNSAVKIGDGNLKRPLLFYIYTGFLLGLNICVSGQYTPAAFCILIYIMIKTVPAKTFRNKNTWWIAIGCFLALLISAALVKGYNIYFEKTVTDVLRSNGAWIPKSSEWLQIALFNGLVDLRRFVGPDITDYRGLAIINDYYGEQTASILSAANAGGYQITIEQYINIFLKYPVDFITRYANRLFLAVSPDGGFLSISRLFVSYTLLYSAFVSLKKRLTTVRKFFSANSLIILSFVLALTAMMVTAIEYRHTMQIQGLIFSVGLLDDTLWDGFKNFFQTIRQCVKSRSLKTLSGKIFPVSFFFYIFFMLFCFTYIATLYDTLGNDSTYYLFRF